MLADFILIGIVIGFISRGNLHNLKQAKLPFLWLIVLGFLIKFSGLLFPERLVNWFNIIGMIMVLIGTLLSHRSYGMKTVSVGAFLNILVILLNGGNMPVSIQMVQTLGLHDLAANLEKGFYVDYSLLTASTRLPYLGDIFPYYSFILFRPFVISPGDYLLGIGLIAFIIFYMRKKDSK